MVSLIKRFSDYVNSLMPKWVSDLLIATIICSCAFYYFYGNIPAKWRFFGNAIISIIVGATIYFSLLFISRYIHNNNLYRVAKDACRELEISPTSESDDDMKKLQRHFIARYSSDKFSNRITNFIGFLMYVFSSVVELVAVGSILFLLFYVPINGYYNDDLSTWYPIMWYVIWWVISIMVYFASKLMFNRYPSEAREFHKSIDK